MTRRGLILAAGVPGLSASNLQRAMDRALAGHLGSALVVDVDSGRLLASHRLEIAARRVARPGSIVKPFTLLAVPSSATLPRLLCARKLRIGSRPMDCTHPPAPAPLDAAAALAYSCNCYFATLAAGLRGPELVETFRRYGLTSRSGWHAREAAGEILPPASGEARQLLALGEANILVTPLAVASAYRKLALQEKGIVAQALAAAAEYGTARLAQPLGARVAGKTGTASDPGSSRTHAWFAGYGQVDRPRVVVVVFLEQGVGGRDAAPVARELFSAALPAP